jgi:3-phenylpropionate/trans-cinnamate dioxygenase ferredoxin component
MSDTTDHTDHTGVHAGGVKVGRIDDVEEADALVIPAATVGHTDDIAVFRSDNGQFYALDNTCTHEVASLAEGWIEGTEVECPLHAAKFCLETGRALCLPAPRGVTAHRVEVIDGDIWLHPASAGMQS